MILLRHNLATTSHREAPSTPPSVHCGLRQGLFPLLPASPTSLYLLLLPSCPSKSVEEETFLLLNVLDSIPSNPWDLIPLITIRIKNTVALKQAGKKKYPPYHLPYIFLYLLYIYFPLSFLAKLSKIVIQMASHLYSLLILSSVCGKISY